MNILIFGHCITEECLNHRKNYEYLIVSARKKLILMSEILSESRHMVDICSVSYSKYINFIFIEQISRNIRIIHLPTIGFRGKLSFFKRTVGSVFNMLWLICHFRYYDVIIFYNYHIEFSLPALIGKFLFKIKIIMDYEDGLFLDKGYQGFFYFLWEKIVYRYADGFILINDGLKSRIGDYLTKKISVTIHGLIDSDLLEKNSTSKKGPVKKIVFSGNFSKGFGFQELLQYTDYLSDEVMFQITGKASSQEEDELQCHINNRPNIYFHGFLEDEEFTQIIEKADAFILLNEVTSPYNQTNFPSKFFSYLSYNKFVITSANPLLTPYLYLKNVILIKNFPHDIEQLHIITKDKETNREEIKLIEQKVKIKLNNFFNAIKNL